MGCGVERCNSATRISTRSKDSKALPVIAPPGGAFTFTRKASYRAGNGPTGAKGETTNPSLVLGGSKCSDCRLSTLGKNGSSHSAKKSEIPKKVMEIPWFFDPNPVSRSFHMA
jgi:hypothetical protein